MIVPERFFRHKLNREPQPKGGRSKEVLARRAAWLSKQAMGHLEEARTLIAEAKQLMLRSGDRSQATSDQHAVAMRFIQITWENCREMERRADAWRQKLRRERLANKAEETDDD